jgi:[acyl-carrier-protein] S-malonyltransferase
MPTTNQHILYLFPGQGAQYQGMGSDLCQDYAVARRVYEQASDVLGFDIADLSFHDSKKQLNLTRFTQPALLTHSIACLEVFKELTGKRVTPLTAAGHSLGEYSALVAASALTFENALRLVQKRGELMGIYGEGEMLAFPLELNVIRPLAEKYYCAIAGYNLQDQTVVGGQSADLDLLAQEALTLFPRKRPARLKTEGAFHTYYMVTAAQHFRPILGAAEIAAPAIRVLSNYTGDYHAAEAASIRSRLFFQLFHPVLWFKNVQQALADGVTTFIEFGGGIGSGNAPGSKRPNLEGIIKKTLRSTNYAVQYLAAIHSQALRETAEIWRSDK